MDTIRSIWVSVGSTRQGRGRVSLYNYMNPIIKAAYASILCPCGSKHILRPGVETPIYYCYGEKWELKAGDEVEYKSITVN